MLGWVEDLESSGPSAARAVAECTAVLAYVGLEAFAAKFIPGGKASAGEAITNLEKFKKTLSCAAARSIVDFAYDWYEGEHDDIADTILKSGTPYLVLWIG